jgi:dihydropteroate synthase
MPLASAATHVTWSTARGVLRFERPVIAGILNVTPDSFSDGGLHESVEAAVRHADRLIDEGADILDVGGESTRPGARRVDAAEERTRVLPVVAALHAEFPGVPLSVDTVKADVARAALDAGAAIINDVSGMRLDAHMPAVVAESGAGVILMHSRGDVEHMARYELAEYSEDPTGDVIAELRTAVQHARAAGVHEDAIVVDPGLGFAKKTAHSLVLLAQLERFRQLGLPILVGPSRKRFIGDAAGAALAVDERLEGTLAACVLALAAGARLFRVHDVRAARRALDFADAAIKAAVPL